MYRDHAADDLKKTPSTEVNHTAAITKCTFDFLPTQQRYKPLGSKGSLSSADLGGKPPSAA